MIEPMGQLSMFPLLPFPFPSIFTRIFSLSSIPYFSLSRAKFIATGEKFRGIQSADIVVTVRRMRENKDKKEERGGRGA